MDLLTDNAAGNNAVLPENSRKIFRWRHGAVPYSPAVCLLIARYDGI